MLEARVVIVVLRGPATTMVPEVVARVMRGQGWEVDVAFVAGVREVALVEEMAIARQRAVAVNAAAG